MKGLMTRRVTSKRVPGPFFGLSKPDISVWRQGEEQKNLLQSGSPETRTFPGSRASQTAISPLPLLAQA